MRLYLFVSAGMMYNCDVCLCHASFFVTYFFIVIKGIKDIVGEARQKVNNKPAAKIIHSNYFGIGDNLSARTDERCVEVEHDVNKENHINDTIKVLGQSGREEESKNET